MARGAQWHEHFPIRRAAARTGNSQTPRNGFDSVVCRNAEVYKIANENVFVETWRCWDCGKRVTFP